AGRRAGRAKGQPKRLGRQGVVGGEVLSDVHGPVTHVADSNSRGDRLRVNEFTNILRLQTETGVGSVVQQEEQLQPGIVPPECNQGSYLTRALTLMHFPMLSVT